LYIKAERAQRIVFGAGRKKIADDRKTITIRYSDTRSLGMATKMLKVFDGSPLECTGKLRLYSRLGTGLLALLLRTGFLGGSVEQIRS
jgi:hypothetical protein